MQTRRSWQRKDTPASASVPESSRSGSLGFENHCSTQIGEVHPKFSVQAIILGQWSAKSRTFGLTAPLPIHRSGRNQSSFLVIPAGSFGRVIRNFAVTQKNMPPHIGVPTCGPYLLRCQPVGACAVATGVQRLNATEPVPDDAMLHATAPCDVERVGWMRDSFGVMEAEKPVRVFRKPLLNEVAGGQKTFGVAVFQRNGSGRRDVPHEIRVIAVQSDVQFVAGIVEAGRAPAGSFAPGNCG